MGDRGQAPVPRFIFSELLKMSLSQQKSGQAALINIDGLWSREESTAKAGKTLTNVEPATPCHSLSKLGSGHGLNAVF